ncbi:MAG: AarF/ABC1/UbiB kinase family protein [Anaerolineae bacterium]
MTSPPQPQIESYRISHIRYWRIVAFFTGLALQMIVLYLLVQPIVGRGLIRRGEDRRLRRWARQFRELAVELGGVMIKLGQFVSSRIDILPPSITGELADLQDEVPPVPFPEMEKTLQEELGENWRARFAWLDETPIAAASLGQAYRAQLVDEDGRPGQRVIVKVQRPGIARIVYTDLQALDVVARLAMRFRFIARRANVPLLLEEFARVLWEELDYEQEARNAERFAELFRHDMGVYIPAIYHAHSTRRVLTLEDVTAIKLNDYAAIEAAGIDRREVAQRLLNTYLTMVFIHRFFHADPHPGNIFIYPLPPEQTAPATPGRPFYLVFVDFGMTGQLTPEIVDGLRETLIALITRDARRLVRSYQQLGVLLPGADLQRIEAASEAVFDRVWGLSITEIASMDMTIMTEVGREFSDLLFSMPFQVPQDFVYLGRAVGILTGMCTGLDPEFDPWASIQPFVRRLLSEGEELSTGRRWLDLLTLDTLRALLSPETVDLALTTGRETLNRAVGLPIRLDNVLTDLQQGTFTLQVRPDADLEHRLKQLEQAQNRTTAVIAFSAMAVCGALLVVAGETVAGLGGLGISSAALLILLVRGRVS